jgi:hypothetical protein
MSSTSTTTAFNTYLISRRYRSSEYVRRNLSVRYFIHRARQDPTFGFIGGCHQLQQQLNCTQHLFDLAAT